MKDDDLDDLGNVVGSNTSLSNTALVTATFLATPFFLGSSSSPSPSESLKKRLCGLLLVSDAFLATVFVADVSSSSSPSESLKKRSCGLLCVSDVSPATRLFADVSSSSSPSESLKNKLCRLLSVSDAFLATLFFAGISSSSPRSDSAEAVKSKDDVGRVTSSNVFLVTPALLAIPSSSSSSSSGSTETTCDPSSLANPPFLHFLLFAGISSSSSSLERGSVKVATSWLSYGDGPAIVS